MDHALTLHSDGTLTITLPKDAEVSRVVVNGASYRQVTGKLDCISRQAAIDAINDFSNRDTTNTEKAVAADIIVDIVKALPSAQPEQRYTEEELRVFKHGISLSLLSKRSSQHWQYDEDTATEIKFLERLYEKVSADMRGAE